MPSSPAPARRPLRIDADAGVWRSGRSWEHPDPGGICQVQEHRSRQAAADCEHQSRLVAWKRQRRAELEAELAPAGQDRAR